jgi:hypothetical protein
MAASTDLLCKILSEKVDRAKKFGPRPTLIKAEKVLIGRSESLVSRLVDTKDGGEAPPVIAADFVWFPPRH